MTGNAQPCRGSSPGADGGHIANLGPLIGQVLGARPAKITFESGPKAHFRFEVDGAASAEFEPVEGQGGGTAEIKGHPLAISPGKPVVVSRASRLKIRRLRDRLRHRGPERFLCSVRLPSLTLI